MQQFVKGVILVCEGCDTTAQAREVCLLFCSIKIFAYEEDQLKDNTHEKD